MIRAAVADARAAAPAMMPSSQQKIEVLAADHARRRRPVGHARQAARREVLPPRRVERVAVADRRGAARRPAVVTLDRRPASDW